MLLLPSLNRIEKLSNFFKSYQNTGCYVPGRVLVDESDFKANQAGYVAINNELMPKNWAIEITKSVTMGGKCREFIPRLKPGTTWVGLVNDDHECISKKCLDKLVDKLDGKNFVSANDRRPDAFRFPVTATLWSMPLLNAVGWPIYPPFLEHLFIDNLWHEIGKATGCWRMVAGSVVIHNHVLWSNAPEDDTHKKVYGEKFSSGEPGEMWKNDEHNFRIFMQTEFSKYVQAIQRFQNFLPGEAWNPKVSGYMLNAEQRSKENRPT